MSGRPNPTSNRRQANKKKDSRPPVSFFSALGTGATCFFQQGKKRRQVNLRTKLVQLQSSHFYVLEARKLQNCSKFKYTAFLTFINYELFTFIRKKCIF